MDDRVIIFGSGSTAVFYDLEYSNQNYDFQTRITQITFFQMTIKITSENRISQKNIFSFVCFYYFSVFLFHENPPCSFLFTFKFKESVLVKHLIKIGNAEGFSSNFSMKYTESSYRNCVCILS